MVSKVFDYIMGYPVYGLDETGTTALILFLSSLLMILVVIIRIHFERYPTAVFFVILLTVSYGFGRMYRDVFKDPEVHITVSSIMLPWSFKILIPIFIYVIALRLQSVKILNMYQLAKVGFFSFLMYASFLFTVFVVIYCLYALSYNWQNRSLVVLCFVVGLFQPEVAIEKLESQGGHVKYLQSFLKTEVFGQMLVSFTLVDVIVKTEDVAEQYEVHPSAVAVNVIVQLAGFFIGLIVGILYLLLAAYVFGDQIVSPIMGFPLLFFAYTSAELCMMSGGASAVAFTIVVTVIQRPRMMQAHDIFSQRLWRSTYIIVISFLMMADGFILGAVDRETDFRMFCFAFGIFVVTVMGRFLFTFLLLQFLYIGRPRWAELTLAVMSPYRGTTSILLALQYGTTDTDEAFQIILTVTVIVFLSVFFNLVLLEWYIERLDIFHLTKAQISNMNAAVNQINKCRANMIFAEKLDRFIADANWPVVTQITAFSHPYKNRVKRSEFADVFKDEVKTIQCPRCGDWTVAPPTRKELEELLRETRLRVLKAQQVSFQKQREAGTLTVNGYKFLTNLVYQATFSEDLTVSTDDLRIVADDMKCLKKCQNLLERIEELTAIQYKWIPTNKFRLKCFRIATSQVFRTLMATLSVIDMNLCLSFVYLFINRPEDGESWPLVSVVVGFIVSIVVIVMYAVNILEASIQILGLGVMQYFSKSVYKVEFLSCIIMRSLQTVLYTSECVDAGYHLNYIYVSPPVVYMNGLLILRVTRFYVFFVSILPCLLRQIQRAIDNDLLRRYDIGNAYLVSLDRVLKYSNRIATDEQILEEVKKSVEADRQKVTKELATIQKINPNIAITVKTKHSIRHVINYMEQCAVGMQNEGILDSIEYYALSKSIDKVRKRLYQLSFISPPLPVNIMKEVLWLQGDNEHTDLFLAEAVMFNYDYSDVLIRNGEDPVGLYILVSGLLKATYVPSPTSIQLANKFGVMPNYDFFENFKFDQTQEEYIVSGNVVGELGLVTGRRYDMTVVADTAAQVYFIPDVVMRMLHETYSGQILLGKIWKKIAVKLSLTLLQFTNNYRQWSVEKLTAFLQRGAMPSLSGIEAVNIDSKVEEAILIEGVAMDVANRNIIYAPFHIPRSVTKLLLPEHRDWDFQTVYETRIFLIIAPGANVSELLETVSDFRLSPATEESIEVELSEEKPKKKIDKSRKVGFTDNADD